MKEERALEILINAQQKAVDDKDYEMLYALDTAIKKMTFQNCSHPSRDEIESAIYILDPMIKQERNITFYGNDITGGVKTAVSILKMVYSNYSRLFQ